MVDATRTGRVPRASRPVVSFGIGRMASARPQDVPDLVLSAVRSAGVRAVLLSGWGGPGLSPSWLAFRDIVNSISGLEP